MKLPASATDELILEFLHMWGLNGQMYLDYENVGHDYDPDFCHVSAKHMAQKQGGRRIHGWALWQYGHVIVANFHSVWESGDGKLHDITPPKVGVRVLFVPDPSLQIFEVNGNAQLFNNRVNIPNVRIDLNGQETSFDTFDMPSDNSSLVSYCAKLGLPNTSML